MAPKNNSALLSTLQKEKYDRYAIERIIEGLDQDAKKIAINTLGNPKVRASHFLKFGTNQGSLSVTTK